jgi:hypothetical protein
VGFKVAALSSLERPNNASGRRDPAANNVVYDNEERKFFVPLITDLTDIEEPLMSQVDIRINIEFHDDAHILWDRSRGCGLQLQVGHCLLRHEGQDDASSEGYERSLEAKLEKEPFKYSHKRVEPKPLSIPANSSTLSSSSITQSSTNPERIMILMQPERLTGCGYEENPLNFGSIFRARNWTAANNLRTSAI